MLLLVDQGLCGLQLWRTLQATAAELVWRCRQDVKLEVLEVSPTGPGVVNWALAIPRANALRYGSSTTAWTIRVALASRSTTGC
jgi:hypothetical protein